MDDPKLDIQLCYTFFYQQQQFEDLILDGIYGIEMDLNLDAKGDILFTVDSPASNPADMWTVDGVKVYFDTNDDVGGPQTMVSD